MSLLSNCFTVKFSSGTSWRGFLFFFSVFLVNLTCSPLQLWNIQSAVGCCFFFVNSHESCVGAPLSQVFYECLFWINFNQQHNSHAQLGDNNYSLFHWTVKILIHIFNDHFGFSRKWPTPKSFTNNFWTSDSLVFLPLTMKAEHLGVYKFLRLLEEFQPSFWSAIINTHNQNEYCQAFIGANSTRLGTTEHVCLDATLPLSIFL